MTQKPKRSPWRAGRRMTFALVLALTLPACSMTRFPAPPPGRAEETELLGIPNARFWVDRSADAFLKEVQAAAAREAETLPPDQRINRPPANYLAISGGGDNGAFGAGILVGWTESGQRPEFQLVTGISAGALTAPERHLHAAPDVLRARILGGVIEDLRERDRQGDTDDGHGAAQAE